MPVVAGEVEHLLGGRGPRQRRRHARGHRVLVEGDLDLAGDGEVEQVRVQRDSFGEPRRPAQDLAEQGAQRRVGGQDREEFGRRRQALQHAVETGHRLVGIGPTRKTREEERDQLGQPLAGAGRAHRRPKPGMPGPHRGGGLAGLAEAELGQRAQRAGIVADAGEHEVAGAVAEPGRVLEQQPVMVRHQAAAALEFRRERRRRGVAAEAGEAFQRLLSSGDRVRLRVVEHLQAVLDAAQKGVGGGEVVGGVAADEALQPQAPQHRHGARTAQHRPLAAEDQLLGLHEELDVADAAAAELDVVAADGDLAAALGRVDLALHRVNVSDGG